MLDRHLQYYSDGCFLPPMCITMRHALSRFCLVAALIGLMSVLFGSAPAAAQDAGGACAEEYEQAQERYYAAEFDAAVQLLRTCLETSDLSTEERVRIYRLLSFAHIAQGDEQQARLTIESLLDLQPGYTPDPSRDRPDYVELVREIKASRQPTGDASDGDRRWVRWTLGGVGAVAAGVLAIVLTGGDSGDGPSDLPGQPPLPPSQ